MKYVKLSRGSTVVTEMYADDGRSVSPEPWYAARGWTVVESGDMPDPEPEVSGD